MNAPFIMAIPLTHVTGMPRVDAVTLGATTASLLVPWTMVGHELNSCDLDSLD